MMKLFSCLLFLIFTIEYIQSQKILRTFIAHRAYVIRGNRLSSFRIYDSTEKICTYQLKPSSSPAVDFMTLVDYLSMNTTADLKGEWLDKIIDVTFTIHDKQSNKWINGTIIKYSGRLLGPYSIQWNSKRIDKENTYFGNNIKIYNTPRKELLAYISHSGWSGKVKHTIKIYSNEYPDALYFFIMAIEDHRAQMAAE